MPRRSAILNRRVLCMSEGVRSEPDYPSRDARAVSAATPVVSIQAGVSVINGPAGQVRSSRGRASARPLLDLPVGACFGNYPGRLLVSLVVCAERRRVLREWRGGVTCRPRRPARRPGPSPATMFARCGHRAAPDPQSFRRGGLLPLKAWWLAYRRYTSRLIARRVLATRRHPGGRLSA